MPSLSACPLWHGCQRGREGAEKGEQEKRSQKRRSIRKKKSDQKSQSLAGGAEGGGGHMNCRLYVMSHGRGRWGSGVGGGCKLVWRNGSKYLHTQFAALTNLLQIFRKRFGSK